MLQLVFFHGLFSRAAPLLRNARLGIDLNARSVAGTVGL